MNSDPFTPFVRLTQTQLGTLFEVPSYEVGRWLMDIHIRDRNGPTESAFADGLVATITKGSMTFPGWHKKRVCKMLQDAGHVLKYALDTSETPNEQLDEAPKLAGPFTTRRMGSDGYEILGDGGKVGVWVRGERNAQFMAAMLNLAGKCGRLPK